MKSLNNQELIKKYVSIDKQSEAIKKANSGYPIQYIIGNVDFYDSIINVDERCLIPRFETEYLVDKTIKKDKPTRLAARRKIMSVLYAASTFEDPKKKKTKKKVDLATKLFDEYAPKYKDRKGGYTRIVKIGQRVGDQAMEVLFELV